MAKTRSGEQLEKNISSIIPWKISNFLSDIPNFTMIRDY